MYCKKILAIKIFIIIGLTALWILFIINLVKFTFLKSSGLFSITLIGLFLVYKLGNKGKSQKGYTGDKDEPTIVLEGYCGH